MAQWTENEVRQLLAEFMGVNKPTILGTVKSVDKDECTCVIEDDGTEVPSVRLRPITGSNNGIVRFPKVGAHVLAVKVETSEDWMMVEATEYESMLINCDSIILNDGENGLVKITEMVSWMQKVYNDLQALKTQLNTWPVVGNGSPLALVFTVTTPQPAQSTFEDKKIKH
jgi:hypothetical protein